MLKTNISKGWKFADFPIVDGYKDIDLPHDYCIKKPRSKDNDLYNAYLPITSGVYVKYLKFEKERHYILDIDGAYACSEVTLNQQLLSLHPHGYTPLLVDLTNSIIDGIENKLVITTNPLQLATRWYSGCGIYRDVFMWDGGAVRIEPWDMFISNESVVDGVAKQRLKFTVTADVDADVTILFAITEKDGKTVACDSISASVTKGEKKELEHFVEIKNVKLWDVDTPNLYNLKTEIKVGDEILDTSLNDFGVKTIYADAEKGLLVNGKPVKLRGGCIHHDHGALGAAAFPKAEERKIALLKKAGFNAVRIAHNPPSLALLEVCDRLGMFVMDEAFDIWNKRKFVVSDYHIFFKEWWQRDISYMVLRDRNHPSVLSYSIGNEIYEIDGTSEAGEWSRKLSDEVRKYDDTKFVTAAIQKVSLATFRPESIDPEDYKQYMIEKNGHGDQEAINRITECFEKPLDIIGFNYHHKHYDLYHKAYPNNVIWGSENWTLDFHDYWQDVVDNSYNIGDFTWTAIDNLGEVGHGLYFWERDKDTVNRWDYPWRTCYQGDLDLCGYRRPQSYFREAVWFGGDVPRIFVTHPEHFGETLYGRGWHFHDVHESWTFDDIYVGRPVQVETYIKADKVEWYVNDKLVGECVPEKTRAVFTTTYKKGKITAVAYRDGKEYSRYTLETCTKVSAINVIPEQNSFKADNRDLCYFEVSLVDSQGRIDVHAENQLVCEVAGGELMGFFSGNPISEDDFNSNRCHAFKGRALVVVKTDNPGTVKVNVYSEDLASGYCQVIAE